MRKIAISCLKALLKTKPLTKAADFVVRALLQTTVSVVHNHQSLKLSHPNPQIRSRNETFSTKEPETLAWIESFGKGEVLWDIGANVGLYSIYAAKLGAQVVAFEPSVFNLEFLVRNIGLNDVVDRVRVAALALGGTSPGFSMLEMSSTAWGDSQNSFGSPSTDAGTGNLRTTQYQVFGLPLDSVSNVLKLDYPHHIKIDVDGIEPEILESGPQTLKRAVSVLVETPRDRGASERISSSLTRAGLNMVLTQRQNQIWRREASS